MTDEQKAAWEAELAKMTEQEVAEIWLNAEPGVETEKELIALGFMELHNIDF